ncbi:bifunctional proline dehydrogenase/L-glutamate gamma-semialdehyde dehydrogenase PutA [uncultured Roseibium sp.]|uniref:bifunctional proline dehydrogenase/L-glutamate gamma-semialdehyde dehydrogenase PutA n=1 Tax=uncultured Roseibium sp. TaxID=1936171 RepID=UPI00321701E9
MNELSAPRKQMSELHLAEDGAVLERLTAKFQPGLDQRRAITARAQSLVEAIRADAAPGLMEVFLAEYGLSTDEGIALMCLAEALLRVPDAETIDDLIEDKIAPSSWGRHLGKSSSSLVNASTWALMLTGRVLDDEKSRGVAQVLHGAVKRVGEPVIRMAVKAAMKEMGNQFVLGESIESALSRGKSMVNKGYTYSYDMLGEAALTARDARKFFNAYSDAIKTIGKQAKSDDIRDNPGISIKLSALHPRYEVGQRDRVMSELVHSTLALTLLAREHNIGLNIDAEEADRLDLSLDVIEAVLRDKRLAGWDGFGVVVQAYGKRAAPALDWLHALAEKLDRKITVRLVKGAYWDSEIKRAQVEGLDGFPVYSRKSATDVSYICCAAKLLGMTDRIYPQFATHNAHTVSAILELAEDKSAFEFQRLHGMGEVLHRQVKQNEGTRCRIYAPVGAHRDLLAYLVRRLLENGANSSFVNQIVDENVPAAQVAADPFEALPADMERPAAHVQCPSDLFAPERTNSKGWDLHDDRDLNDIDRNRKPFLKATWVAEPILATEFRGIAPRQVHSPSNPGDPIGTLTEATLEDAEAALDAACDWSDCPGSQRAEILNRAATLYEQNFGEIFAALTREAGKTPPDAIAELREAVDFLRYYAARISGLGEREQRGLFACISPWNFPLAIFTGQIAAALAAGNGVLAKPAEPSPIIASIALRLLHEAGVPRSVLQLLPGRGSVIGAKIVSDPRISGVCFTGSTGTAQMINRSMAKRAAPDAPLIAETGGLNAMIVDSTALPEQAIRDIINSAFRSAGQRCSALRILFLQEDVAPAFLDMLYGAMDELVLGNPWDYSTDVGPVITETARQEIEAHIETARSEGRLLKQLKPPKEGTFVGPAALRVDGMKDMHREIFGPVLHITTFKAQDVDRIIADINASGYGLTFGLHTRIDDRVEHVTTSLNVGNIYVNRNQIGAIVGSQPFGGEGLSGTGPKAGGPNYVTRFARWPEQFASKVDASASVERKAVQEALDQLPDTGRTILKTLEMPGPTGESNRLSLYPRGKVLCLGPTPEDALEQAQIAQENGCPALVVCPGVNAGSAIAGYLNRDDLTGLSGIALVALWSDEADLRAARMALAQRDGPLVPLATDRDMAGYCHLERHVCIDTTASGGNASLLAAAGA